MESEWQKQFLPSGLLFVLAGDMIPQQILFFSIVTSAEEKLIHSTLLLLENDTVLMVSLIDFLLKLLGFVFI